MPGPDIEGHWGLGGEPPVEVEVTVLSARRPTALERIGSITATARDQAILSIVLVVAATASVVAIVALSAGGRGVIREGNAARWADTPGVAAAYRHPVLCSSVAIALPDARFAIALHDPRFARAAFGRALPCGRDAQYPAGIFAASAPVDTAARRCQVFVSGAPAVATCAS